MTGSVGLNCSITGCLISANESRFGLMSHAGDRHSRKVNNDSDNASQMRPGMNRKCRRPLNFNTTLLCCLLNEKITRGHCDAATTLQSLSVCVTRREKIRSCWQAPKCCSWFFDLLLLLTDLRLLYTTAVLPNLAAAGDSSAHMCWRLLVTLSLYMGY